MLIGKVSQQDMESYNNDAAKSYNEKALDACPNCGRTFLPDRLVVHLRSCNKGNGRADASPEPKKGGAMGGGMGGASGGGTMGGSAGRGGQASPSKPAFVSRPKTIMCYIW